MSWLCYTQNVPTTGFKEPKVQFCDACTLGTVPVFQREAPMMNFHLNHTPWSAGRSIATLLFVLFLAFTLTSTVAQGQDTAPAAAANSDVTPDEVNQVARELWCPLCSGVRLDSCELKACDQMKEVIAIKLAEGDDTESIKDYFVEQYGPQVLGAPPLEGFNWLAWILPFVVLIGGGVFLWMRARQMIRPASVSADVHGGESVEKSEYEQRLEEELKQYG